MSTLGSLVVKLVLDNLGKYKADLGEAAKETQDAASKIETSTNRASTSTAGLVDKMGAVEQVAGAARGELLGAAQGAQVLTAGAGAAALAVGAMALAIVAGSAAAGFAAYKGIEEQIQFQKSLTLTGNMAGTTASKMNAMAESIGNVVGTQGKAAAALAQMAGTGRVAGENLEKFSQVAVEMQRTVGTSVADTVKQFAELGAEPVKASLRLNETTNYLTASTFAQIKAADELGDKTLAASLAQNAFADAQKTRTAAIEASLNVLGKAWRAVGELAESAWDKMLNLGRDVGLGKQLEQQKSALANAETLLAKGGLGQGQAQQLVDTLRQKLTVTQEAIRLEGRAAQFASDSVAAEKAKISWMQEGDKYLTKKEKSEIAIKRIRTEGAAAGASEIEIEKRIAAERAKGETRQSGAKVNPADGVFKGISERTAGLRAELVAEENLTAAQKAANKVLDDLRTGALTLTEAEKQRMGVALEQLLTEDAANVAKVKAIKLQAENGKIIEKNTEAVIKQDAARKKAVDGEAQTNQKLRDEIALIGLNETQRAERLQLIERETIAQLELNLVQAQGNENRSSAVADLEREIALRRERVGLISEKGQKAEAAKRSESITASITDGLLNGFRNGRSIGQIAIDELKAQWGKAVLQPVIKPLVDMGNAFISDMFKGLMGGGGGGGTGIGGIGGGLAGSLASVFGGGSSNPSALNYVNSMDAMSDAASGGGFLSGVGSMFSSLFSFDGGGDTGNGPRSGGLDGKGGFLAMMHPQEDVYDRTKGQTPGGSSVTYVTNNTFGSSVSRAEVYEGYRRATAEAVTQVYENGRRRRA